MHPQDHIRAVGQIRREGTNIAGRARPGRLHCQAPHPGPKVGPRPIGSSGIVRRHPENCFEVSIVAQPWPIRFNFSSEFKKKAAGSTFTQSEPINAASRQIFKKFSKVLLRNLFVTDRPGPSNSGSPFTITVFFVNVDQLTNPLPHLSGINKTMLQITCLASRRRLYPLWADLFIGPLTVTLAAVF